MKGCCNSGRSNKAMPKKHLCPTNGREYSTVPTATIVHHLKHPWTWEDLEETYYFCDAPDCEVVYFSSSNKTILRNQIRTTLGQKEQSDKAILCYCFGVTQGDYALNKGLKAYVIKQTKNKLCACTIRNPSGKCCLKDFPVD